jgi:sucrose-6F-phosphate phosphohydrolase
MTDQYSLEERVLVSDIDGTLLDEGEPTPGLALLWATISLFNDQVRLIYATGRTFLSTWALIEDGVLPLPDAIAASVGTEVWLPPWTEPDPEYHRVLARGWSRDAVFSAISSVTALELQPSEFQGPFKVSFFADDRSTVAQVNRALTSAGVRARVVYSAGRFLDVMPEQAGKLGAVDHLLEVWGVSRANALACGDSGNDLDLFEAEDLPSVIVGNAEPEVREDRIRGDLLHHSRYPFAAGVLEGAKNLDFWS